ncbi:hypothetical protein CEXT_82861 [Caerostris extrusa]|uniref:Uncharacterized protein n=1 Tax=Caerostris extrusa TaxID=172846 RepID=A0AAV4PT19_CAEEX|nr:hypothetical protein CEXT_82861 [Caerostris extrusa]
MVERKTLIPHFDRILSVMATHFKKRCSMGIPVERSGEYSLGGKRECFSTSSNCDINGRRFFFLLIYFIGNVRLISSELRIVSAFLILNFGSIRNDLRTILERNHFCLFESFLFPE